MSVEEKVALYIGFPLSVLGLGYAFNQRGRFFVIPEAIYLGGIAAHSFIQIYKSLKGTVLDFIAVGQVLLIIPLIIGLLAFTRLTKFRWLARYPVALLSGAGVGALWGLVIKSQLLAPIGDTVKAMFETKPAYDPLSQLVFAVLFVPIILMFLYTRKYSNIAYEKTATPILYYAQRFGRVAFMVIVGYQISGYAFTAPTRYIQSVVKPVLDDLAAALLR